jgi:putative ABC transport system permease protein
MLSHYLAVALRTFRRSPAAALLNVFTLALGLVAFIAAAGVIGFWDRAEQRFPGADRIYVVTSNLEVPDNGLVTGVMTGTNHYVAQYLKADFPALEAVARVVFVNANASYVSGDRSIRIVEFGADPDFLDVFDLPFIAGDARDALRQPRSAVMTEDAARRLFGNPRAALGQSVVLGNVWEATVTGVVGPIPEPSHLGRSASASLRFDALTSRDIYEAVLRERFGGDTMTGPENWIGAQNVTYVKFPADGSLTPDLLRAQLPDFVRRHVPPEQIERMRLELGLIPVTDLLARDGGGAFELLGGGLAASTVLWLLGSLVLAIACVNYANLTVARAVGRARDVGLRKALGAERGQVVMQYLAEAAVLTVAALAVAIAAVALLAPAFEAASGIDVRIGLFSDVRAWLTLAAVVVVVTVVAGAYPAFVLARARPVFALRVGSVRTGPRLLSTLLVGAQFAITSFLLIAVTITYLQNRELQRTALGAAQAPLVVLENYAALTEVSHETFHEQLLAVPQVTAATAMPYEPWTGAARAGIRRTPDAAATDGGALRYDVSDGFFETYGIPVLAGRGLERARGDDRTAGPNDPGQAMSIVVDRTLSRQLGFGAPEDAVGQAVFGGTFGDGTLRYEIVGVVEDRPLALVGFGITGTMYAWSTDPTFHIVRVDPADVPGAMRNLEALWKRLIPGMAPNIRFADDYFAQSYAGFARVNQVFTVLGLFALAIATLGLFAMALLVATRRAREIGVRKVLGANTVSIVGLLLRSFSVPVLIAGVVAWPLAYFAARAYLSRFVSPIELSPAPFALCLLFILSIAWLAVGGQTWRAARRRPASVLRTE